MTEGTIVSIRGVVVDVQFPEGQMPKIYDALVINTKETGKLTFEVQALLGNNMVRTVAMGSVYGLKRGFNGSN
jgi:F-type H+-transporting ATPase subunit beta